MENDKSNISFETIKKLIDFYDIDVSSLDVSKFMTKRKLVEQSIVSHDQTSATGITVNHISEKLILQMEERIVEMKKDIEDSQSRLDKYEK